MTKHCAHRLFVFSLDPLHHLVVADVQFHAVILRLRGLQEDGRWRLRRHDSVYCQKTQPNAAKARKWPSNVGTQHRKKRKEKENKNPKTEAKGSFHTVGGRRKNNTYKREIRTLMVVKITYSYNSILTDFL